MTDLFSLSGRIALVTGASRGLGHAMARALAEAGAHVVLNGRHAETLEPAVAALKADGLAASAAPFDVSEESAAERAITGIVAEHDGLDILVANAGVNHKADLAEFTTADWNRVIATNLTACFALARLVAPHMRARGGGRLIFTASMMSRLGRATIPAYVASKHGVAGLTKALAAELGRDGITVNAIAPGYIETEMTAALQAMPDFDRMIVQRTPLGRWGVPADLAGPVVFLASEASRYVNGILLFVDGGLTPTLTSEDPAAYPGA